MLIANNQIPSLFDEMKSLHCSAASNLGLRLIAALE
jgi:hypothetical protein